MLATISFRLLAAVLLLLLVAISSTDSEDRNYIDEFEVRNLALRFGKDVAEGSAESTCLRKITSNFEEMKARVVWFDANKMAEEMRIDVENMLNWKKHAVERIANESQRLAANHTFEHNLNFVDYLNMKEIYNEDDEMPKAQDEKIEYKPIKLSPHPNFESSKVNLDSSAIHVPINVYQKAAEIVNDIKWSEALTPFFKNNLAFDPGLSWQFFGSSKGFLRLYPATQWTMDNNILGDDKMIDLYDCRMRPWYIQGAASAKDVVILLDSSGSMTGQRNMIAKNVVATILDTLTDDDYVSVLNFAEKPEFVNIYPECFNSLVQANKKNVRAFKEAVDKKVRPSDVANFTSALVKAFELLQGTNKAKLGAQCNQAIMLITDGAPENYAEVFRQYNWPNIPIRVFTYLIGREVTANNEVYWMACHNRGYYTHVANLAEVREQVQQYIPVMSRPIVLSGERVFAWTPVYAHVSEVPLTDWVWEEREKAMKTKMILMAQKPANPHSQMIDASDEHQNSNSVGDGSTPTVSDDDDSLINIQSDQTDKQKKPKPKKDLLLMTTLATPVFDTRNYTNITRRILVKNVYQDSEPETIRIANLLGVAGVDVPIKEIVKLTPAFKLGVNGYSFMTTNNGYLLCHPDLRPMFQDMLKPYYSSVDMSEVELADNNLNPREMDPTIKEVRDDLINRNMGWKKRKVKIHMDSMKRAVTRTNHYIYGRINFTPFSLAIVLPEPYGSYRVEGQIEVKVRREENFTHFFRNNQWKVHPEWVYCDSPHKMSAIMFKSPEEGITQFLKSVVNGHNFRWKTSSTRPQVYETISCDKYLIQSLVFDARATDIDISKCGAPSFNNIEEQKLKMFGIVTTFVATRSGLTRYEDHRTEEEKNNSTNDPPFFEVHTRATEELYYRRAVDFHMINDSAFVFSVPFDAGTKSSDQVLVTGSHAIFLGSGKSSAPVAVVGLQFKHSVFTQRFINLTIKYAKELCVENGLNKCYLLDNNGFIIYSNVEHKYTGKFFGELDGPTLLAMVGLNVYRKVHMFDYQAICLKNIPHENFASILMTPFHHFKTIMFWFWTRVFSLYVNIWYNSWFIEASGDYENEYADYDYPDNERKNNKTQPYPCDKEFDLYEMMGNLSEEPIKGESTCGTDCIRNFVVQTVPYTNLLLVVVPNTCCPELQPIRFEPNEVAYTSNHSCDLLKTEMLRKRPTKCHSYHPQEKDIKQCGGSSQIFISLPLLISMSFILLLEIT